MAVAPIGFAVHPYGLEAGIEEKNFERTPCGGVAPLEGAYILFEPVKHKYQLLGLGGFGLRVILGFAGKQSSPAGVRSRMRS